MATDELKHLIWQLVATIPEGKVASYGQIATAAGYPNHARFVAKVLKALPKDSKLPWHRVINAQGRIAFSLGSDAYNKQLARLEGEGLVFKQGKLQASDFCQF